MQYEDQNNNKAKKDTAKNSGKCNLFYQAN